jgi:hypothetical protein
LKGSDLISGWFDTTWVVAATEIGRNSQSSTGCGGTSRVEDFLVRIQGFARPVSRNFREESMLNAIPLGSAGGIVGYGYGQGKGINQLRLKLSFPGVTAATVAATGIGQNEQLA